MKRAALLRCASGAFWLLAALAFFRDPLGRAVGLGDTMLLRVVSPEGEEIRVNGASRGAAPALLEIPCRTGETLRVEIGTESPLETPCRPGETLEIPMGLETP